MAYDFYKLRIPPNSPLRKLLKIKEKDSGDYRVRWSEKEGELLLFSQDGKVSYTLNVSAEQFQAIRMMAQQLTDKNTPNELKQAKLVSRSSSFSGTKDFPAHHIIPIAVCKNSKLIMQAKTLKCFDENHSINRLELPATFHRGSHDKYSKFVEDVLDGEWDDLVENDSEEDEELIKETITQVIEYLKDKIAEMKAANLVSIDKL